MSKKIKSLKKSLKKKKKLLKEKEFLITNICLEIMKNQEKIEEQIQEIMKQLK